MTDISDFEELPGHALEAVRFAADYVEFDIHGAILRVRSEPALAQGSSVVRFPDVGSRDALCQLYDQRVVSVSERSDRLEVRFEGGATLEIPLANQSIGSEAAYFLGIVNGRSTGPRVWESSAAVQEPNEPGPRFEPDTEGSVGTRAVMVDIAEFQELPGHSLTAVCFVTDYVTFEIDGASLRALSGPVLADGSSVKRFPDGGSRDALCDLIGQKVEIVTEHRDCLEVRFELGAGFEIPLANRKTGPEVAHFVPVANGRLDTRNMHIWENLIPTGLLGT